MYVRRASAWSTVLYAAAALDDELPDAQRTAAIAKAYVARAAREVAHGALQVFGGIAFTEEHQAHRFLRRIVVREQQFGDAAHHERELGRALAVSRDGARMTETGFNDPTAQRLERISTGADPELVGPLLADALHDPRWLDCDVALISGGKSNLTYRVACDAGEVDPAPPAARAHPAHRARHGPRVPRAHRARRAPPCPCRAPCISATSSARRST